MPLLAKKIFNCVKSLTDLKEDETVYTIPHTKEQFRSRNEFDKRIHLYKSRVWTCQSTGHINLTHEEAWNSEKTVLKTLKEQFAPCYDKPVLELVHHSTQSLDSLVDQAWLMLQQTLVIGERVLLKVKAGGKSMKAIVVKSDKAGCERNPTSNCSSPSSDKENTDSANSPKKWVPPKLLPYKYSIRFENEDSVIHSVPACDLSRGDKPPSKELLRLFIRTYAVRAGQAGSSPWIVDEAQVKKLDLASKFAGFLLSPVKWKAEDIAKKLDEEMKNHISPAKNSPRIKTKMDAKEERKKEKAKKSLSKLQEKGERAKAAKEAAAKKKEVIEVDSSSSDESDSSDSSDDDADDDDDNIKYQNNKSVTEISDSDSDTPLSVMKTQIIPKTPPKKKSSSVDTSKDKNKEKKSNSKKSSDKKKGGSLAEMKKKLEKKKSLSLADLKEQLEKKKVKKTGEKQKKEKGGKGEKKKKGQDPKQLTLFDLSKKKGLKTPEKKQKSPQKSPLKQQKTPDGKPKIMSPPRTPAIVKKIQKAQKDNHVSLVGTYTSQAAKILSSVQRARLPDGIRELVQKKYDIFQEKQKLARMSEAERKEYLTQKAIKQKEIMRQKMKERMKNLKKRYEDTMLDLKPLPQPKLVATPEGLTNEAFGDVAMVTEFISCYAGLLMPDDEYPIYTDALMKALTTGKEGFTYLSRVLVVLLQTLLQDQIAEDYQEIKVPLSDIPVNPCTTSELVRLCLRKQDIDDDKSEGSKHSEEEEEEEDEVSDELIQLLETQEFYQLQPDQKLQILKGLCLRIMGTYSVQDYMEERQQESARLWKEKVAQQKENKDKRIAEKEEKKLQKETEKENKKESKEKSQKESENDVEKNMLLTHFYGKKNTDEAPSSGNTSEATEIGDDDGDLASVVKRRRVTAAKALEERRKKEIEERTRREKNMELYKEQKEKELFDKQFTEGIQLAKVTQRQSPIGTDRNHCRYWIFSDVTPGLFVEKGWVGEEMEYTCNTNTDDNNDSSSSSESEEDEEEGSTAPKKKKVDKCVDKTFPHVGQNLWFSYSLLSEVDNLVQALHQNGSRESVLKKEIQKRYKDISRAISKAQRTNNELRKCDGEAEVKDTLKKELLETEMRLRNGGLGGVEDFSSWNCRLETSEDKDTMAECLLETQAAVLEKFRDGIMMIKKKKQVLTEDIKEDPDEGEEEEEEEEIAPGIQRWRDAVKSAGTFSRLHVLLGILDSCIKWEKSSENAKCKICRKKGDEDRLLLCDDCNQAFHMYCLRPALLALPHGDWHCPACAPQYRKRIRDVPGRYKEGADSSDDEDIKQAKTDSIKHDTHCVECGSDENLIECAECPSVYHLECHDPPLRHPPRGRWVCNDCKNGITTRQRKNRQGRQAKNSSKGGGGGRKRKRYVESSDEGEDESEEDDNDEGEESDSDEPPRKAARRSGGARRGPKPKTSPKGGPGRPKGRKSVSSPEITYDPKPKSSRRAPSELSVMEDIVNQMLSYKDAWPFYHNVNKKDVPDYYDIIKQPISFQKIKDRLNCLVYGSPKEVIDAVALLFRNGIEYNKIGSEVYRCLESSEKYFVSLLKDSLPQYSYSRDNMANGYSDHMYSDEGRKSRRSK